MGNDSSRKFPSFSVIMPTLNSERTLEECLSSIAMQDYPKKRLEIIVADGGSSDATAQIARSFGARVFPNPLKTGEAGKAVGIKKAKGELLAFIDSDNILPEKSWLKKMAAPFSDREIVCAEPINYTWRKKDNYITRYCALMGLNDPLVYFAGNYDRHNGLDGKWTRSKVRVEKKDGYEKAWAVQQPFPTVGANGFVARKSALKGFSGDYFVDVDVAAGMISSFPFAKAHVGIIHLYSGSFSTFVRKQDRRIRDFLHYSGKNSGKNQRSPQKISGFVLAEFCAASLLVFPVFLQALHGYSKKRDVAWFFHVPASIATVLIYGAGFLRAKLFGAKELSRKKWSQ